ncbi:hybrid sensor histidine kinase/response regulator [Methylogaea oryzae]|uniref:hybrid sensor histidine kinase/response regulator n=1 Tax=Methylogaea oryzae TaxID=1295382 RepID=UPI0006CFF2A6|nr:histidine kinase [Methylogaea oryzae]
MQTAEELKASLEDGQWDIVLSDYNLPSFNAVDALCVVKACRLDIPFVVVSGHVGEETAVSLLKLGVHDFVAKHNLARLVPAVAREIHEARCREEQRRAGAELIESRQQLRDLSNFLQSMREDERARIARELHDDLGQSLTALKMDMSWLKKRLPEEQPVLTQKADDMLKLIDAPWSPSAASPPICGRACWTTWGWLPPWNGCWRIFPSDTASPMS